MDTGGNLILRNVRPLGAEVTDVSIRAGRIDKIGATLPTDPRTPEEQGHGAILLPGLVDAHTHLDKTLWGMGWRAHQAGPSLLDKIETERRLRSEWDIDPYRQSMRQALLSLGHGTIAIRSHVDIDTEVGLAGLEGVARTRSELADEMFIEIVAFPQSGLMSRPGTLELLDEALQGEADVVGGLDPCGIDGDPKGQLDAVFALAEKHGKPIDIHLHEPGELGAFSMEQIIARTLAHGLQGKVTISHAFCLGMPDRDRARALIANLAEARIHIATVATPSRPVPLLEDLRAAGVILCAGSDGIRDTWGPYGNADMLERAMLLGLRNALRLDQDVEDAFRCCSQNGARVMEVEGYVLEKGCIADLILVDAETVTHAVVSHPPRRLVLKAGRPVARQGKSLRDPP